MAVDMFTDGCTVCGRYIDRVNESATVICDDCADKHEADATLGALVRALPSGYALWRTTATNRWIVTDIHHREVLRTVGEDDTPEKAIAAALEVENENV